MGNLSTIIVFSVIAALVIFAAIHYVKTRKNGCCTCNGCDGCKVPEKKAVRVYIDGMKCSHCAESVENAFSQIGCSAKVNLEKKFAYVTSSSLPDDKALREMIENLGFKYIKTENI